MPKPVLGRGLGALLGGVASGPRPDAPSEGEPESSSGDAVRTVQLLPLHQIRPCPFQPRREFSQESLQELANSIKEQGILQPLIVRQQHDHYELIAGERRWRASQFLGLKEVPVLVRSAQDHEVLELALIENLQRDNLNPLEEAVGYSRLIEEFKLRQEDVADKVGKSRATVANALRLLKLPESIQAAIRDGRLTVGHAKAILGLPMAEQQQMVCERILKEALNVRQAESLVARLQQAPDRAPSASPEKSLSTAADASLDDLENRIRERFGTRVRLHYRRGKGYLQIRFFNHEDLDRVLRLAGVSLE